MDDLPIEYQFCLERDLAVTVPLPPLPFNPGLVFLWLIFVHSNQRLVIIYLIDTFSN